MESNRKRLITSWKKQTCFICLLDNFLPQSGGSIHKKIEALVRLGSVTPDATRSQETQNDTTIQFNTPMKYQ